MGSGGHDGGLKKIFEISSLAMNCWAEGVSSQLLRVWREQRYYFADGRHACCRRDRCVVLVAEAGCPFVPAAGSPKH